jgi:hypothetical protein
VIYERSRFKRYGILPGLYAIRRHPEIILAGRFAMNAKISMNAIKKKEDASAMHLKHTILFLHQHRYAGKHLKANVSLNI